MTIWVSPTEPPALRELGRTSMLPEQFGCDVYWRTATGGWGVQRKALADLYASVDDGRLGQQLAQIRGSDTHALVVVEGAPTWDVDGNIATYISRHRRGSWTVARYFGTLLRIQSSGARLLQVRDVNETLDAVESWHRHSEKPSDERVDIARPAPRGIWGSDPTSRDYAIHLLTSIPGIGSKHAGAIFDHYGRLPLSWDDPSLLSAIPGIGPKKIATIKSLFSRDDSSPESPAGT